MMNGALRPADRGQSDVAHVSAPAAAADTARKSTFSLPSLRGGSDADIHSSYSQQSQQQHQAHPYASSFDWNEPERGRSTQPVALNPHHSQPTSTHPSHARQPYTSQQQQEQIHSNSRGTHSSSDSTTSNSASTKNEPEQNENGNAFTPPASASDGGTSGGGNGDGRGSHDSSQDSQLFQLSQLAAAREKLPADIDTITSPVSSGLKRKRMGPDGVQILGREPLSTSPVFGAPGKGHSRNTSTVSMTSTGSRMGELSHELKTRLSYAMVKVNNGWESHSIDEVESLASRAASPNSTTSTIPGRKGSSASPRLFGTNNRSPTRPAGRLANPGQDRRAPYQVGPQFGPNAAATNPAMSPPPLLKPAASLAPPVSIKPSLPSVNPRRNSTPAFSPIFLSHGYVSASPRTPVEHGTPRQATARTPLADPMVFSPHQNVREQDAIESLLFMSSPGNSANLKHSFPSSSSQPVVSNRTGAVVSGSRTALPSGQPRRTLPSSRPSISYPTKRVGFEASSSTLSDMEVDGPLSTSRGLTRGAKVNGNEHVEAQRPRIPLTLPAGLGTTSKPRRPTLTEADIDEMLDQFVAEDDLDSDEEEIQIPVRTPGMGTVGS